MRAVTIGLSLVSIIVAFALLSGDGSSPSASAAVQFNWGDVDCSGSVSPLDALKTLMTAAGIPVQQTTQSCPGLGSDATVNGMILKWGDGDCDHLINQVDALKVLETVAGIPVTQTIAGCPDFGSPVTLDGGGVTPSPTVAPASITLRKTTAYYDNLGALSVVGEAFNGSSHAVSLVKVTANFYSAGNVLLATQDGYACLKTIAGGAESPYRILLQNPPPGIDHYSYQVTGVFDPAPLPLPLGLQLSITNTYLDGAGIWHTVGTIKNNSLSTTFTSVRACGAYYNASGDVIRTNAPNTTPSTLAPGQSGTFDVIAIGVSLDAANVVVIEDGDQ